MSDSQTILVTGGSGFIGTLVCMDLVEQGYDVINIDRVKKEIPGVTQYPFDINNHQVEGLIQLIQPEAIIHLAADHNVRASKNQPWKFYENNVANTIMLMNCAVQASVKHFVFSSSSSVYGNAKNIPTPESSPLNPQSAYARSKTFVEQMLPDYEKAHGMNFVSLRYFNAAGADLDRKHGYVQEPQSHLIPIVARAMVQNNTVKIYGADHDTTDGFCERDYTHVKDVSAAHVKALEYLILGGPSDIFNIGTGTSTSVASVIHQAAQESQNHIDYEIVETHDEEIDLTCADISRAKNILNWSPQYSLEDIIRDAYIWEKTKKKTK